MKVLVAKTAGFCWGVRRAMDAVLEASSRADGRTVQTLGPLIHNPQALELIGKRGVAVADAPDKVQDGTVVIRAHGIPIQDLRGLKERQARGELKIVNATCPEVAKVHSKIKKWSPQGYFTVILGSHGHAESVAHQSFAEHGSVIVNNLDEARALSDEQLKKVLVVAQTTFTVKDFDTIVEELRKRAGDLVVENTICEDTWRRQAEARDVASKVDAVVIVGGKNSANTRHLAELAHQYGKPCQFVETAAEMDLSAFKGLESVGVLAGASTPTWLVEEVVADLEQMGKGPQRILRSFRTTLASPLRLAVGAALMATGIHAWMDAPLSWHYPLLTAAYVAAMYLLAPYMDPLGMGARGPARARSLVRHRPLLLGLGIGSLGVALGLAAWRGIGSFGVVAAASALGLLYRRSIKIGPKEYSLALIPGSKDVLVSLALAVVAVALPLWHHSAVWNAQVWAGTAFAGALVFARTSVRNLQDLQNDQIQGRETLPMLLGRKGTKIALGVVLSLAFVWVAWMTFSHDLRHPWIQCLIFACAAAYPMLHLWLLHERFTAGKRAFQPPLELGFYLVGLLAL
ncbi:MAG: 4-hydroxy-3-methylbut-2-enyl diphosphate reductase [Firmicutes bacterium]|nr:4-hydroxy-3-methylbut-2-enyl diphosphate reductase [Bacillota bacterium]